MGTVMKYTGGSWIKYTCHKCNCMTVHQAGRGITCTVCGTDHIDDTLGATPMTAIHLESLITSPADIANDMTRCKAHLGEDKETDCKWYQESSTAKRCMYWREDCECCDKLVVNEKEIN